MCRIAVGLGHALRSLGNRRRKKRVTLRLGLSTRGNKHCALWAAPKTHTFQEQLAARPATAHKKHLAGRHEVVETRPNVFISGNGRKCDLVREESSSHGQSCVPWHLLSNGTPDISLLTNLFHSGIFFFYQILI